MKKFLAITIFVFPFVLIGQNREVEMTYQKLRSQIKSSGVKSISESVSYNYSQKSDWEQLEKELRWEYNFDSFGNLIAIKQWSSMYKGFPRWVISYSYNKEGGFVSKTETNFDATGNAQKARNWKFEYDEWGNSVYEELLSSEGEVTLNNTLAYDSKGNITSQVRDDYYRWEFDYNLDGTLSQRREYRKMDGSFKCEMFITYNYDNHCLLQTETKKSPLDSATEWNKKVYLYDSLSQLVEIIETKAYWIRPNDSTTITGYTDFQSILEYDNQGKLIRKLLFRPGYLYPYRCYFYEYTY